MSLYSELRARHPVFIYHSYEITENTLRFHFSMGEHHFYPRWEFPFPLAGGDEELTDRLCFSLGMAELVSYWKCACPPAVEIRCGALSQWQREWWKKLYFNGLGEFFYRNGIQPDFDDFMMINAPEPQAENLSPKDNALSGVLVPVGGGKDSAVTLELLKKAGADITPYAINKRKAITGCVEAAGIPPEKLASPSRTIDKTLLQLNAEGYLNGHTPFSAVVAFSAELTAALLGSKYIALSNESSANEAYVDGTDINHQYSKSTEFESDFREYCVRSFGGFSRCAEYFSLLRPWSEWQIAREFVKYPRYFGVFQSCNLGGKTDIWCCNCAKCLYVYILLSAFLDDDVLEGIFGCDMLGKTELSGMLDGLILDGVDKPFECVGTRGEVRLSLEMAAERRAGQQLPPLLQRYPELREKYRFPIPGRESAERFFDGNNFVPAEFIPLLKGE